MTVACIIVRNLPCRVEAARREGLRYAPLVLYDEHSSRRRVVDATPGCRIHAGMPLDTALERCPRAVIVAADPDTYAQQWRDVIARLRSVRDAVDDAGLGIAGVELNADGDPTPDEPRVVAALMRCVPPDWEPRVGVASDRIAAHCAAGIARAGHALRVPDAPEERRRFLAPLPVDLLPADFRTLAGLHDRGIHRLGRLDDLSAEALEFAINPASGFPGQRAA